MQDSSINFIVGIGASAGGLDAINELFDHLPANLGNAYIIVQHLSPDFESFMPELLARHTKMKISTAEDGLVIKPDHIYLNDRSNNLIIKNGILRFSKKPPRDQLNLPIDLFFYSMSRGFNEKAIAVILSGTGGDGSKGIQSVKEHGGLVIAQDPKTTQFDGMARAAINTHHVDYIKSPEEIVSVLARFSKGISPTSLDEKRDALIDHLLDLIEQETGVSFKAYKLNTLIRRLEKRIETSGKKDLKAYLEFLKTDIDECNALKNDFLINVTSFFRDSEAYQSLQTSLINRIENKVDNKEFRVWSIGCSTGEEICSVLITIDTIIRHQKRNISYKIFATDISQAALDIASRGVYSADKMNGLDLESKERYFEKIEDDFKLKDEYKKKILFTPYNILTDPPFVKTDLVICRNLLIYIQPRYQLEVIDKIYFSLLSKGILFLGNSEVLGEAESSFATINGRWKIFEKKGGLPRKRPPKITKPSSKDLYSSVINANVPSNKDFEEYVYQQLLNRAFAPDCILFDDTFEIKYIVGDGGKFLRPREGVFSNNLMDQLDKQTRSLLRHGIQQMDEDKDRLVIEHISGDQTIKNIVLQRLRAENLCLIYFEENPRTETPVISISDKKVQSTLEIQVRELEEQLRKKTYQLNNLTEELESSNEELQASNEELVSSNEELQSSNEELQALNEELYTVNSELQQKNHELYDTSAQIENIMNASAVPMLVLDDNLKIIRYTTAMANIYPVKSTDVGRKLSTFNSVFSPEGDNTLLQEINAVCDEEKHMSEFELPSAKEDNKKVFRIRVMSLHRGAEFKPGVIITFQDITHIVEEKDGYLQFLETLYATDKVGIRIYEYPSQKPVYISEGFRLLFGWSKQELEVLTADEMLQWVHPDDTVATKAYFDSAADLKKGEWTGFEFRFYVKSGQLKWLQVTDRVYEPATDDQPLRILNVVIDISETKRSEKLIREQKDRLDRALASSKSGIWEYDIARDQTWYDESLGKLLGMEEDSKRSESFMVDVWGKAYQSEMSTLIADVKQGNHEFLDIQMQLKNDPRYFNVQGHLVRSPEGQPEKIVGVTSDVTDIVKLKNERQTLLEKLSHYMPVGIRLLKLPNMQLLYSNQAFCDITGYTHKELNGMDFGIEMVHESSRELLKKHIQLVIKGKSDDIHVSFYHKSGTVRFAHLQTSAFDWNEGKRPATLLTVMTDITDIKENQIALQRANDQLEAFSYSIAHDLKAPLRAISNYSELILEEGKMKKDQRTDLTRILDNSKKMNRLIEDMLNFSKVTRGNITRRKFNLGKLIQEIIDELKEHNEQCRKATIHLSNDLTNIIGDRISLKQVFYNLLSNAFQYSAHKETPEVKVTMQQDDKQVYITVEDNGKGFDDRYVQKVFEIFQRLDVTTEGSGVGLAIVKRIVEKHHGEVKVVSKPDQGAAFTVVLPNSM